MKKVLFAAAAMSFCAIGFATYTDLSSQSQDIVSGVHVATIQEAMDRDDYEMGQFRLARYCELGFTVPGHSISACKAAYVGAYQRGEFDQALQYATTGCQRDKDRAQCRKANVLTVRMNWGAPVTVADILASATAGE